MQNNNVTMTVIINGQSGNFDAREYTSPQDRQTYVEGREGSNFSLRLHNGNPFRVLAIPSVDGLSVLDGEEAGEHSSGYILEARQTLDIPGWMVDSSTAAKFFFAGMKAGGDQSYVAQVGKDTSNKGVIGLMVFREKNQYTYAPMRASGATRGATTRGFEKKGMAPPSAGFGGPIWSDNSSLFGGFGATFNSVTGDASMNSVVACAAAPSSMTQSMEDETPLGTGFGEATDFSTVKADFQRGDLLAMLVIYYADARGLKRKGIDVSAQATKTPQPFPAMKTGCKTPDGWVKP